MRVGKADGCGVNQVVNKNESAKVRKDIILDTVGLQKCHIFSCKHVNEKINVS